MNKFPSKEPWFDNGSLTTEQPRGFAVMVFHLRQGVLDRHNHEALSGTNTTRYVHEQVSSAPETRYHSTELEVVCLVWTCYKLQRMIQSDNYPMVVLTICAATKASMTELILI